MFKAYVFIKRRPGTAIEDFEAYYEQEHAPLVASKLPGLRSYVRHYLRTRHDAYRSDAEGPYDVMTEIRFDDRAAFEAGMKQLTSPETAEAIAEDQGRVFDRESMVICTVEEEKETDPTRFI